MNSSTWSGLYGSKDWASTLNRRRQISILARQGISNVNDIATRLGLPLTDTVRKYIGSDLVVVKGRWKKALLKNIATHQAREMAKIDEVERLAWESYNKSLMINEKGEATCQGNTKHQEIILKCISKRCEILGIINNSRSTEAVPGLRGGSPITIDEFVQQAALNSKEYRIRRTEVIINNQNPIDSDINPLKSDENNPKVIESIENTDQSNENNENTEDLDKNYKEPYNELDFVDWNDVRSVS